jgi:hypothetical protein
VPDQEGVVRLHARDAFVHGQTLRYEPQPFKDTLGWWSNPADWASWTFKIPQARRYSVAIVQGCGTGSGGSEVAFAVNDRVLTASVLDTGGFQNFVHRELGEFDLGAGLQTLTVRPENKQGAAIMDLREVILRPGPTLP